VAAAVKENKVMPFRACFLICVISLTGAEWSNAQSGPVLPLDDPALWNYNALLARGHLTGFDSGVFPVLEASYFTQLGDLSTSNIRLATIVERSKSRLFSDSASTTRNYGIRVRPGITLASQESANFLRPEMSRTAAIYSMVGYESWFTAGKFTAAWGMRHDRYYDRDPEGLDTAHRWFIRPENAYLSYSGTYARIFLGRVRQHWGGYSQPGLVLSDNPRPMDHLAFRIGTDRLNVQTSLSELDSMTGDKRFTGTAGDDSVSSGSERRYLAVHKLTFSKPGAWSLGLMHSVLYSGESSGLSLKFMNPFNLALLSVDEKPKNDENNGLLGAFFQFQRPSTVIQGQIALDDLDILNGKEPASIAATLFVYRADFMRHTDLMVGGSLVTARTYNADQPEGKYLYLRRGIATQYSDYASGYIAAPMMMGRGVVVTPRLDVLFQGEADIRAPFPDHDAVPVLFDGIVERTVRPSIESRALLTGSLDLALQAGISLVQNEHHISGASSSYFSGSLSVRYRWMWQGAY